MKNRAEWLIGDFDGVIFNHGIGQQLLAHAVELRTRGSLVGSLKGHIKDLALTHRADIAETEAGQSAFDGLPLRIEHTGLEGDNDTSLHGSRLVIEEDAGVLLHESGAGCQRVFCFNQNAEPLGHFTIGID